MVLAAAFIFSPLAQAGDKPIDETPTTRDEILKLIAAGTPEPLRGDIGAVVGKMMNPRLGVPLSRSFDPKSAIVNLLGRGAKLAPDCRQVFTRAGDVDRLPCIASVGTAAGKGAYRELGFSKAMALGNVSFFQRAADRDITIADLVPVKLGDAEAFAAAKNWLSTNFGLTMEEIPVAPDGATNPYPVHTIAMAAMDDGGKMQAVEVEKQVLIHRGLFVGLGGGFDWIRAPGAAFVSVNDMGVMQASVKGWQELVVNPDVDPRNAKSLADLQNEIADDLAGIMKGPVDHILIGLIYGVTSPVNDNDVRGLLLPAVQVFVSTVPADLTEAQQEELASTQVSTASVVRQYPLVNFPAETRGDN